MPEPEGLGWFWDNPVIKALADAGGVISETGDASIKSIRSGGWLDAIFDWLNKQDIAGEKDHLQTLANGLAAAGVPTALIDRLKSYAKDVSPNVPPFRSLQAWLLVVLSGVQILSGPLKGVGQVTQRAFNKQLQLEYPDLATLIQYTWRTEGTEAIDKFAPEMGFSKTMRQIIEMGNRPILSLGEMQEDFRRGIGDYKAGIDFDSLTPPTGINYDKIYPEYFKRYAKVLGYNENDSRKLFDQTYQLLPLGHLDELKRRGIITDDQWSKGYNSHGFKIADRFEMHKLLKPLVSIGDVGAMYHRGLIDTPINAGLEIEKHGFDKETADNLLAISYKLPDIWSLTTMYHRGLINEEGYLARLEELGYDNRDAKMLEHSTWLLPTPSDLVRFGVREVYTPSIRKRFRMDEDFPKELGVEAEKIGYKDITIRQHWAAHWDLPAPTQGFEMFHRGIITEPDLRMLLRALDIMPFWRDRVIQLSYRLIPRRGLGKLRVQGILSEKQLFQHYKALGYSPVDAMAFTDSAEADRNNKYRDLSQSELMDAFRIGVIKVHALRSGLRTLGYEYKYVEYFVAKAELQKTKADTSSNATEEAEVTAEAKSAMKKEILQGYHNGMLTYDESLAYLANLELTKTTCIYLLSYQDLRRSLDDLNTKTKYIKQLFDAELITDNETLQKLVNAGVIVRESTRLLDLWKLERTTERQLAAVRLRQPSRTNLENWLKKGIIMPLEWQVSMAQLGYPDESILRYLNEIIVDQGA